jgi:hypothetical protein
MGLKEKEKAARRVASQALRNPRDAHVRFRGKADMACCGANFRLPKADIAPTD